MSAQQQSNWVIFNYPKVDKPSVQDLGIGGVEYPLTISFAGPDNDLVSTEFFNALTQSGKWTINHPSKGMSYFYNRLVFRNQFSLLNQVI